jgi:hypothetical protein
MSVLFRRLVVITGIHTVVLFSALSQIMINREAGIIDIRGKGF